MRHASAALLLAATFLGSAAHGQTADEAALADGAFQEIEAGVEDANPFAASFRSQMADFRQPTGFDRVYRVGGLDDRFMRAQGGLYAVFPRSVYATTREGEVAVIPPSATFYVGRAAMDQLVETTQVDRALRERPLATDERALPPAAYRAIRPLVDGASRRSKRYGLVSRAAATETPHVGPDLAPRSVVEVDADASAPRRDDELRLTPPPIVDDATYRRARLEQLMRRAAAAAQPADASDDQPRSE